MWVRRDLEPRDTRQSQNRFAGVPGDVAERRAGAIRAAHIRERMRTLGPTVRPDLGKQAEGTAGTFAAPEG